LPRFRRGRAPGFVQGHPHQQLEEIVSVRKVKFAPLLAEKKALECLLNDVVRANPPLQTPIEVPASQLEQDSTVAPPDERRRIIADTWVIRSKAVEQFCHRS
jgi:hypothetical protein